MLHETLEYLGIAFISSVLLIIMSKIILQALIRRPVDYYDAEELMEEELMLNAAGISMSEEHETNPEGEPMMETHMEAHVSDFHAAEPEEIIEDIPEAVHESIEFTPDDEDSDDYIEEDGYDMAIYETSDETESEAPTEETGAKVQTEETGTEEQMEETGIEEQTEETVTEEQIPAEPDYTFKIKAKTSRTKKPKKREEPEPEENAPEEADGQGSSEWNESYAEIRNSLEKAYSDRNPAQDDKADNSKAKSDKKASGGKKKSKNKNRPRKPSMKMNKNELLSVAESKGVSVPEGATKKQILDLIYDEINRNSGK